MAIITTAEVKTLLQITASTYDSLIGTLIPLVQQKIIEYCRNSFLNTEIQCISSAISFVKDGSTYTIEDSNSLFVENLFVVGDYKVRGSKLNDGIHTIGTVAADKLTLSAGTVLIDEAAANEIVITRVEFPADLKMEVAEFIRYSLTATGKLVKSETLPGGYSVTYKDEKSVLNLFSRYRKPYQ